MTTTANRKHKEVFFVTGFCLICLCLICSREAAASWENGDVSAQVNSGLAVMTPGQTRTFTSESDTLLNAMIIPVVVWGAGTLNITVSKTDSTGEIIGVIYQSSGYPDSGYNVGITPLSLSLSTRFWWDYGTALITSAMLFPVGDGPHKYSVRLSY